MLLSCNALVRTQCNHENKDIGKGSGIVGDPHSEEYTKSKQSGMDRQYKMLL